MCVCVCVCVCVYVCIYTYCTDVSGVSFVMFLLTAYLHARKDITFPLIVAWNSFPTEMVIQPRKKNIVAENLFLGNFRCVDYIC